MKILYFGGLRASIGVAEDDVIPPPDVATLADLRRFLCQRSPRHAAALQDGRRLCAAINQNYAGLDQHISANDEVAFFPPVTGG